MDRRNRRRGLTWTGLPRRGRRTRSSARSIIGHGSATRLVGPRAHHESYELHLADGRIVRPRVSRSADRTTYGRGMWRHILRDQLDVDAEAFWTTVCEGIAQRRTEAPRRIEHCRAIWSGYS